MEFKTGVFIVINSKTLVSPLDLMPWMAALNLYTIERSLIISWLTILLRRSLQHKQNKLTLDSTINKKRKLSKDDFDSPELSRVQSPCYQSDDYIDSIISPFKDDPYRNSNSLWHNFTPAPPLAAFLDNFFPVL